MTRKTERRGKHQHDGEPVRSRCARQNLHQNHSCPNTLKPHSTISPPRFLQSRLEHDSPILEPALTDVAHNAELARGPSIGIVTISFISTAQAERFEKGACAAEVVRNWDRCGGQSPSEGHTSKQPHNSSRRPGNRKICPDGATPLQHAENRERALHLHELRRTPNSATTRHGILWLEN